jgi:hypothetical protein
VKLLTGNDLPTGDVIWWTGSGWSRHIEDAVDVADHGEAIATEEAGARRVNSPYVIDASATPEGPLGPTVRPDLTLKPADPNAGSWVI